MPRNERSQTSASAKLTLQMKVNQYLKVLKAVRYLIINPRAMMTSSNGNIFRVIGHLCGEFTGPGEVPAQRTVTRSFDVFFDLHPNEWLSKQWWGYRAHYDVTV